MKAVLPVILLIVFAVYGTLKPPFEYGYGVQVQAAVLQAPVLELRTHTRPSGSDTLRYIFIGHGYSWQPPANHVDIRLERLDYSRFDRIMLGGDMCADAFAEYAVLQYLDSIFHISSPRTHYALGNHEARNENHEWFEEITGHKTYTVASANGITIVVLNTTLNPGNCEELDAQFRMLKSVCDTIRSSSHLLILQHHGIWNKVPGVHWNQYYYSNWPMPFWDANCFQDSTLYHQSVYPLLVKVQQRGVQVVNVMGDFGVLYKARSMQTEDGIYFLSSGIDNSRFFTNAAALDTVPKDKLLLFEHVPAERKMWWRFVDLDSLAAQ